MATIRSVDSFLYLGSLYSHLTVIVGQRLCATLGSHHHHHHHHYISSDVSSEQRRPYGCITISVQLQKNIENDVITTPYLKGQAPLEHSKPNYVSSKYWSSGHQRKSLKCLWQILHIRWHQDVTTAYFVTHQFLLEVQWGGKAGPDGIPHFPRERMH